MRRKISIHIITVIYIMMLLSCHKVYRSEAITYTGTNDGKGGRLDTKFSITVDMSKLDDIYKSGYDGSEVSDVFLTGAIRTKIRIFLRNYTHTVDSVTLLNGIKDGSLNQLIKEQIKDWPRLEGVEFKKVKVVVGE